MGCNCTMAHPIEAEPGNGSVLRIESQATGDRNTSRLKLSQDLRPRVNLDEQRRARRSKLQRAVDEAERDLADSNWVEHSEIDAKLRRWSTGERRPRVAVVAAR